MHSIFHGVPWIHLIPALVAVALSFIFVRSKRTYAKAILGVLWFLFLPNTAYVLTDVYRFSHQVNSTAGLSFVSLIVQYGVILLLGLISYVVAMLPLERIMKARLVPSKAQIIIIVLLNFIIAFGITLGKLENVNSWFVFTDPTYTLKSCLQIITSIDQILLVIVMGIICNFIYFLFRNLLLNRIVEAKIEKKHISC